MSINNMYHVSPKCRKNLQKAWERRDKESALWFGKATLHENKKRKVG